MTGDTELQCPDGPACVLPFVHNVLLSSRLRQAECLMTVSLTAWVIDPITTMTLGKKRFLFFFQWRTNSQNIVVVKYQNWHQDIGTEVAV